MSEVVVRLWWGVAVLVCVVGVSGCGGPNLGEVKTEAITQVEQMSGLGDGNKNDLRWLIESATDPEAVGRIVEDAETENAKRLAAKAEGEAKFNQWIGIPLLLVDASTDIIFPSFEDEDLLEVWGQVPEEEVLIFNEDGTLETTPDLTTVLNGASTWEKTDSHSGVRLCNPSGECEQLYLQGKETDPTLVTLAPLTAGPGGRFLLFQAGTP